MSKTKIEETNRFEYIEPNTSGIPIRISVGRDIREIKKGDIMSRLHFHDEIEIISVIVGAIVFVLADGSRHEVCAGNTVCVDSRVIHSTYSGDNGHKNNMLQFRSDLFDEVEKKSGYEKYLKRFAGIHEKHIIVTDDKDVFNAVSAICAEYTEQKEGSDLYIKSHIYYLLGFLHRNGFLSSDFKTDTAKISRLAPVLSYVDENYASDIKLSEMSKLIGVSEYHFCRIWKSTVGASFVDYLNFVRISKADKLLRKTDESVLDIAFDTGFSSLSYFNRVFNKFRNCSPTVYRKASKEIYEI